MNKTAVNSLLAIGVALGTSAISTLPAAAAWMIGGNAGYQLWCPSGTASVLCADQSNTDANLTSLLLGSPGNPGGNIELGLPATIAADFTKATTLTGIVGGHSITLSSLTKNDWEANGGALTTNFLKDTLDANGIAYTATEFTTLVNTFISMGGRERFSNPNIGYIYEGPGNYTIGLEGVLNASTLLKSIFPTIAAQIPSVVQASEVVKVGNDYLYSFKALNSGLSTIGPLAVCTGAAATGVTDPKAVCSHTGDYAITVPEPSSLLGLLVMGGGLLAVKRGKKS